MKSIMFLLIIVFSSFGCKDNPKLKRHQTSGSRSHTNINNNSQEVTVDKALKWLDNLDVNPITLRKEMGIKGKKKFVELISIYMVLFQNTKNEKQRRKYKNIVSKLCKISKDLVYHDLNKISDKQFTEDSTSYLRAWYVMKELGLDTEYYKKQIFKIIPRLKTNLAARGTSQKIIFFFYFTELGLPPETTVEKIFEESMIRAKLKPEEYTYSEGYTLTHEIFNLYYNNALQILHPEDLRYLKEIIPLLVTKYIYDDDIDLLAEFITAMTYLKMIDINEYDLAVNYLLSSQNENGSFGKYENLRSRYLEIGIDIEYQRYLHTTSVSVKALAIAGKNRETVAKENSK